MKSGLGFPRVIHQQAAGRGGVRIAARFAQMFQAALDDGVRIQ